MFFLVEPVEILLRHPWCRSSNSPSALQLPTCSIPGRTGCLIKLLWLHPGCGGKAKGSPQKHLITKAYQLAQQKVTVDDAQLSKLAIPLLKLNSKCVSEFIRRQEALSARNATDQGLGILRRHQSLSTASQPTAPELPDEQPHTSRPQVQYELPPSLAGTRKIKMRQPKQGPNILPVAPAPPQMPSTSALATPSDVPQTSSHPQVRLIQVSASAAASAATLPAAPVAPPQPLSMSRATFYKRKRQHSDTEAKHVVNVHFCSMCGQNTQGHKKYRRKTYCHSKKASSSKELVGQTFESYEDFTIAVDKLFYDKIPKPSV